MTRIALRHFALACGLFFVVTLWALEWNGVATIRTTDANGNVRTTRVWYVAESEDTILLEAAGPASPWLSDVRSNAGLIFESTDLEGRYRATVRENPAGHDEIRSRLREKYGARDRWVGLLVDTSGSSLVSLESSNDSVSPDRR